MWNNLILDPMINILLMIYQALGSNFGLSIIVFTIIIRLITLPLTLKQQKSTMKMQELQQTKKWQDIQTKYKDNKQKLQEEQLKLYQEIGFNPLSGCLPTVIQFPIIIGLYQAIIRSLASTPVQLMELANHIYDIIPDSLIPLNNQFLWMNLGQPERLYLPFLPTIGIPVLTILVVLSSYFQTKLITPPSTGTDQGQGAMMNNFMSLYMPVLMGYFAYSYASGLALYFVASNLLGILQYAAMGKLDLSKLLPVKKQS
ncbi:MAG: membrane protein insertase YidC [Anaerolineales bacterium]|nr:membrane protein insertase YidC [Anaerolineales bacterium]